MEKHKKNKPYFVVGLNVTYKNTDIEDMGRHLGIKPRVMRRIADKRWGTDGQVLGEYADNYSLFDDVGGCIQGESLDKRLTRVADQLGQIKDLISTIKEEGGAVGVTIGWFISNHTSTGATFNSSLFKKLGELQVDVWLYLYGDDGAQSSSIANEK